MADTTPEDDREVRLEEWTPPSHANEPSKLTAEPQRLKSALWYAIGQIVDEESLKRNRNATPQFIGALTEMVWAQIGT